MSKRKEEYIRRRLLIRGGPLRIRAKKSSLLQTRVTHAYLLKQEFTNNRWNLRLAKVLVSMLRVYSKKATLREARQLFDEMPKLDCCPWSAMIFAYATDGHHEEALSLFSQMRSAGTHPDNYTYKAVLPVFTAHGALELGKLSHCAVLAGGYALDEYLASALVSMYAKCGKINDATKVFDKMTNPELGVYNALLGMYASRGLLVKAMGLFQSMYTKNVYSWSMMLNCCLRHGSIDMAEEIFYQTPGKNLVTCNTMLTGYVEYGYLEDAMRLFSKMRIRDVYSWTIMIQGFAENRLRHNALMMFRNMMWCTRVRPDARMFCYVLRACRKNIGHLKCLHGYLVRTNIYGVDGVRNLLMEMYAEFGSIIYAMRVFDSSQDKNLQLAISMIRGYMKRGLVDEAYYVFQAMPRKNTITWNSMIRGYLRKENLESAIRLFNIMPNKDTFSWTAIISGLVYHGKFAEALQMFREMQETKVQSNCFTFDAVLPAISNLGALEHGRIVHEKMIRKGFVLHDVQVCDYLIEMYAKCGCIDQARKVFDTMPCPGVSSWYFMINAYASYGLAKQALKVFQQMQDSMVTPNSKIICAVLSACCHAGLLREGWELFERMTKDYNITPSLGHCCCIVHLLGRLGFLEEACGFIKNMSIKPNEGVWSCLLVACINHGNLKLGELVADQLLEFNFKHGPFFVMLSYIYAAVGRQNNAKRLIRFMRETHNVRKIPAVSWIEINGHIHGFQSENVSQKYV